MEKDSKRVIKWKITVKSRICKRGVEEESRKIPEDIEKSLVKETSSGQGVQERVEVRGRRVKETVKNS